MAFTTLRPELDKLRAPRPGTKRRLVWIGRRLLLVTWWPEAGSQRGTVVPLIPWHRDALHDGIPIQTIATFKISHLGTEWETGDVQNISVVDRHQREGWGTALVEALFTPFPDITWRVTGANEKSTGLFQKLHAKHGSTRIQAPKEGQS